MALQLSNQEAVIRIQGTGTLSDTIPTRVRYRKYNLNTDKALNKKLAGCNAKASYEETKGNLTFYLDTAGFEAFRGSIIECIHLPRNGQARSRHVEYIKGEEQSNLIVDETIKIHSWMGVAKQLSGSKTGSCFFVINLYRTTCTVVVNGQSYKSVTSPLIKLFETITDSHVVRSVNSQIKEAIKKQMDTKKKKSKCTSNLPNSPAKCTDTLGFLTISDIHHIDTPTEDCPTCNIPVDDEGVECEVCEQWYHYKCEVLSDDETQMLENTNKQYTCKACYTLITPQVDLSSGPPMPTVIADAQHTDNSAAQSAQLSGSRLVVHLPTEATTPMFQVKEKVVPTSEATISKLGEQAKPPPTLAPTAVLNMQPTTNMAALRARQPGAPTPTASTSTPNSATMVYHDTPDTTCLLPPPPLLHDQHMILQHLDITVRDNNRMQQELDELRSQHENLKKEVETKKTDLDNTKKKLQAKERLLKQREAGVATREAELSELGDQNTLLKTHINELELSANDLQEQNRLLKLKLLSSEDVRKGQQAIPQPTNQGDQLGVVVNLLTASLLKMLTDTAPQTRQQQPVTKIVNICYPQNNYRKHPYRQHSHWQKPREEHPYRQHSHWQKPREEVDHSFTPASSIIEYNHGLPPVTTLPALHQDPVDMEMDEASGYETQVHSISEMKVKPMSPIESKPVLTQITTAGVQYATMHPALRTQERDVSLAEPSPANPEPSSAETHREAMFTQTTNVCMQHIPMNTALPAPLSTEMQSPPSALPSVSVTITPHTDDRVAPAPTSSQHFLGRGHVIKDPDKPNC